MWVRQDSAGSVRICNDSPGVRVRQDSRYYYTRGPREATAKYHTRCVRQDSPGFATTPQDSQDSPRFARTRQDSPGFSRIRQDSPGFARIR